MSRDRIWHQSKPTRFQLYVKAAILRLGAPVFVTLFQRKAKFLNIISIILMVLMLLLLAFYYFFILYAERWGISSYQLACVAFLILLSYFGVIFVRYEVDSMIEVYGQLKASLNDFDGMSFKLPEGSKFIYLRPFSAEAHHARNSFTRAWSNAIELTEHSGNLIRRYVASLKKYGTVYEALNLERPPAPYSGLTPRFHEICLYEFDDWHKHIRDICLAATLIVIHVADNTDYLAYELDITAVFRDKLVILIEDGLVGYGIVWEKIFNCLTSRGDKPLVISYHGQDRTFYTGDGRGEDNRQLLDGQLLSYNGSLQRTRINLSPEVFLNLCNRNFVI